MKLRSSRVLASALQETVLLGVGYLCPASVLQRAGMEGLPGFQSGRKGPQGTSGPGEHRTAVSLTNGHLPLGGMGSQVCSSQVGMELGNLAGNRNGTVLLDRGLGQER